MLSIGDSVKIIKPTMTSTGLRDFFKVGTICKVSDVFNNGEYYGITDGNYEFYYLEEELEKGKLVWVPEK